MTTSYRQANAGHGSSQRHSPGQAASDQHEIDLHALAEKVYHMLKRELITERERMGWKRNRQA
jgi:protein required for attachment to host cells